MPTNAQRAERAERALVAYKGAERGPAISDEMITDLLCDLEHLLKRGGVEEPDVHMDALLDKAHWHYSDEEE